MGRNAFDSIVGIALFKAGIVDDRTRLIPGVALYGELTEMGYPPMGLEQEHEFGAKPAGTSSVFSNYGACTDV